VTDGLAIWEPDCRATGQRTIVALQIRAPGGSPGAARHRPARSGPARRISAIPKNTAPTCVDKFVIASACVANFLSLKIVNLFLSFSRERGEAFTGIQVEHLTIDQKVSPPNPRNVFVFQ